MRLSKLAITLCTASLSLAGAEQAHAAGNCRIQVGSARCVVPHDRVTGNLDRANATDARFVRAPEGQPAEGGGFKAGDILPDDYMVLFNSRRYDLPAPADGWTYFKVGTDIYRADLFTRTVIEQVR